MLNTRYNCYCSRHSSNCCSVCRNCSNTHRIQRDHCCNLCYGRCSDAALLTRPLLQRLQQQFRQWLRRVRPVSQSSWRTSRLVHSARTGLNWTLLWTAALEYMRWKLCELKTVFVLLQPVNTKYYQDADARDQWTRRVTGSTCLVQVNLAYVLCTCLCVPCSRDDGCVVCGLWFIPPRDSHDVQFNT